MLVERVGAWFKDGAGMENCGGGPGLYVSVVVCVAVMEEGNAPGCGAGGLDEDVGAGGGCGRAPGCGAGGNEGSSCDAAVGAAVVFEGTGTDWFSSGAAVWGVTPCGWRGALA